MPMNEGESWDYEWDYESLPTSKIDRWREKEVGSSPVYFIELNPGTDPVGSGPVAQGIRARGYEPRCRGFESLLARNQSSPDEISLLSSDLVFCLGRSRHVILGATLKIAIE